MIEHTCLRSIVVACFIACQALHIGASHAEDGDKPISEEVTKQADIYRSRGTDVPEGYVVNRSLLSYTIFLTPDFLGTLARLGANERWLDIGAGEGRAVLDYCASKYDAMMPAALGHAKADAVAMSIEDRRTSEWYENGACDRKRVRYLFGKRLREYSNEELGRFQLITDVLGGFSYTRYLSVFMTKVLGVLDVNGSFYTVLQDVHSQGGVNRPFYAGASFLTEITDIARREVKVCSWLKSISCVEVSCEFKPNSAPPIEMYRVRKVCDAVSVPELVLTHFEAGTPPERRYVMLGQPVAAERDKKAE